MKNEKNRISNLFLYSTAESIFNECEDAPRPDQYWEELVTGLNQRIVELEEERDNYEATSIHFEQQFIEAATERDQLKTWVARQAQHFTDLLKAYTKRGKKIRELQQGNEND